MVVDKAPPAKWRSYLSSGQRKKLIKQLKNSYKKVNLINNYAKIQQQKAAQEAEEILNKNKNLFD